jgi:hypothetical protein
MMNGQMQENKGGEFKAEQRIKNHRHKLSQCLSEIDPVDLCPAVFYSVKYTAMRIQRKH